MALTEEQLKAHRDWRLKNLDREIRSWWGINANNWIDYLNALESIVWTNWTNWTPTQWSWKPTFNYWYYSNPSSATDLEHSTIVDGVLTHNPMNDRPYWYGVNSNGTTAWAYQPFSVADTLNQRAQGYQAQWLTWLANSYRTLNKENTAYNNTANKIASYYEQLANDINSRENALAQQKESLANRLSQDIANQRQYVMDYFGPNGIFTNEVNKFYDENWNYLASEAGRQMAMANAEGIQSWASLWAQRAARNEAYNNAFQNYLKTKEQELSAKMSIQQQLVNYMQALRQEYWETQNAYVISQYQRANDLLNAISNNMANSQIQIEQARLQQALAASGISGDSEVAASMDRLARNDYERDGDWTLTPAWQRKRFTDMYNVRKHWLTLEEIVDNQWRPTGRYETNILWQTYTLEDIIDAWLIPNAKKTAGTSVETE